MALLKDKIRDHFAEEMLFIRRASVAMVLVVACFGVLVANLYRLQIKQHGFYQTRSNQNDIKMGWICAGILVCFFLLAFRVGYLQLLEHQQLTDQADQRSIHTQVLPTNRGMITDRNGEALAVSVSSRDIVLDPKHILDTHTDLTNERWQNLANVLKMPLTEVQKLIQTNAHKRFVYLARKVEDDNANYISKLRLTGVSTEQDFSRFYPMSQDAAGLIGIVGQDNQGLEGIELGFNHLLQGKNGLRVYQKDLRCQTRYFIQDPRFTW